MEDKDRITKWAEAQTNAAMLQLAGQSEEGKPKDQGMTINAHTVIVNTGNSNQNHIGPKAESTKKISEAQSRLLKHLVGRIGKAERARNPTYHNAKTWIAANEMAGVKRHHDIAQDDFDTVKNFLDEWIKRLEQPPPAPKVEEATPAPKLGLLQKLIAMALGPR